MPRRTALRLVAVLTAAALSSRGAADDCGGLATLETRLADAADAVASARATLRSGGDSATSLAALSAALDAAGAADDDAPPALRRRIAAATDAVARAAARAGDTAFVRRRLAAAARGVARAARIAERTADAVVCGVTLNGAIGPTAVFPADNWWNEDISARAVAANSDAVIDFIGRDTPMHADFGTTFGIPYVVLDGPQPLSPVTFGYDDESDAGAPARPAGYPIPALARTTAGFVEGGVAGGGSSGDRHLLLVDRASGFLFELYAARWTGSAWTAGSGAVFDLTSNARRPEGWTSADAAGLAILPGLVRADEAIDAGEIRHALRFTVRATMGYVFPASHDATHGAGGDLRPPLGLRVRLKASTDLTGMSAPARAVFTAMKTYGLILADNGSDWFVTGAPDPRWDDEAMHDDFARVHGSDFEVVVGD